MSAQRHQAVGHSIVFPICLFFLMVYHSTSGHNELFCFGDYFWHFLQGFKVFSLSLSHSISVDVQKRPNMQEKVSKGHCCSYTTWSSLTFSISALTEGKKKNKKHTTQKITVGNPWWEAILWEDVFSLIIRKASLWLWLDIPRNVLFCKLAEALLWHRKS